MPKKYKARRKKFLPNHKNQKTTSLMIDGAQVVPDEMMVKLRFNVSGFHGGTGIIASELAGNNPQAVFPGGSGLNAAMGMNEWSEFYSRFQVLGSKISLDFLVDTDPTLKKAIKIAVVPYSSPGSPPTSIQQAAEMSFAKTRLLAENQNKIYKLNSYMGSKKILGYHNSIDDVEFTHGNMLSKSPPTQEWRWGIYSSSLGATNYELQFDGYIDYYVRLFVRKTVFPSTTPAS